MWQKLSPGLATWQDTKIDPNSWCYSGLLGCFTAHMLLLLLLKRLCRLRMQASIIIISCQINPARVSHASTPAYKASPSTLSYSQIGSGPLEVLNSACPQHSTRHDVVPRHRVSDFGHTRMIDNAPMRSAVAAANQLRQLRCYCQASEAALHLHQEPQDRPSTSSERECQVLGPAIFLN
jgi:hypothetical protein